MNAKSGGSALEEGVGGAQESVLSLSGETLAPRSLRASLESAADETGASSSTSDETRGSRASASRFADQCNSSTATSRMVMRAPARSRQVVTTETFLGGPATPHTKETAYDDTATGHAMATRDARGFVTTARLTWVQY